MVREPPPPQVRRHRPLEQEELTEEQEPEQSCSPPQETRHWPLLHEVDRPADGDIEVISDWDYVGPVLQVISEQSSPPSS